MHFKLDNNDEGLKSAKINATPFSNPSSLIHKYFANRDNIFIIIAFYQNNVTQRFEYGACRTLFNNFLWFQYFQIY